MTGETTGAVVEIQDLGLIYEAADAPVHALSGIELTIERGDFVSLIG
ncbi:MAG: ABC transporter ATP-binding protein, partial [Proteobacteria bacterium]|nr:ABC transporter ATP-binding protein [Pseudomonadota bacterium]